MAFEVGNIVFAKLKGFPWWPGLVEKEDELPENILKQRPDGQDYICVKFFGSTNYGWIIEKNLKPFTKKEANDKLKQTKKKSSLVGAINQALEYLPSGTAYTIIKRNNNNIINNINNSNNNSNNNNKRGKRKMNEEDEASANSAGSSNGITRRKDDIKIKGKEGKEKVKEMTNQSVQNNVVINNHNDGGSGDGRTTRKRTRNNDNDNQVSNNQNKAVKRQKNNNTSTFAKSSSSSSYNTRRSARVQNNKEVAVKKK